MMSDAYLLLSPNDAIHEGACPSVAQFGFTLIDSVLLAACDDRGTPEQFYPLGRVLIVFKSGNKAQIWDGKPGERNGDLYLETNCEPTEQEFRDIEQLMEFCFKTAVSERTFLGTREQVRQKARKAGEN